MLTIHHCVCFVYIYLHFKQLTCVQKHELKAYKNIITDFIKMELSIIGAGNISWHLSQAFKNSGISIKQIFSRDLSKAKSMAKLVEAEPINSIKDLSPDTDLILICVSDKAIPEVVENIGFYDKTIAHTAGSVSLSALKKFTNHGVFYPLQTFTKGNYLNLLQTPFCIEANNTETQTKLLNLAKQISNSIYELSSEQRLQCHLAAVFANNFSNHMFHAAEQILKQKNIPFDIIKPIIAETANKIQNLSPKTAQTGPAARNDKSTIEAHLKLLSDSEMEKLYSFVSQNIWKLKQEDEQ